MRAAGGLSPPRSSVAAPLICEAIRKRVRLEFSYDGKLRVVEPYCHGWGDKGEEKLRAHQVRGGSSQGGKGFGFGKLWSVEKIVGPRLLDEPFKPNDPNYNPNDSAMTRIHCRI